MFSKLLLPLIALAGAVYAAVTVAAGSQPAPVAKPIAEPSRPPYESYIAGSGLTEAAGRNVAIGSPLARVVVEVSVRAGDEVPAGAPLFRLDDRDLAAELEVRRGALGGVQARLERLRSAPRAEDLPPVEARVAAFGAEIADLRNQVALWESVADKRAVTAEDVQRRKFALQAGEARLAEAKAQLALLGAGTWKADLLVAEADAASAAAQVKAIDVELARLVVRAPVKGVVLQVNIRAGEFASAGPLAAPLVLFGALDRIHLRVDIDENDAWRFKAGSAAMAFVRGNRDLKTDLKLEYVEPYVVPKKSLTGDSSERVDTRVMQAVYSFPRGAIPVLIGQQMDVFLQVPRNGANP